jgi:N-acyl-D-amino-acid deacylase
MRPLFFFFLLLATAVDAQEYDLLIRNGKVVDGTGNAWYRADVGIKNGKIAKIGSLPTATAARILNANGMVVCPGFIDVHTHIEDEEFKLPTADNFIYDGVTSVITGNCGLSNVNLGLYFKQSISAHSLVTTTCGERSWAVSTACQRPPNSSAWKPL